MATRKLAAGRADNPTVRYVDLTIGEETFKLIFDFNSIATAEQVAKVNLLQAIEFKGMNAQQYRGLLYAALLKRHPGITLPEVGDLITLERMPAITDALLEAWKRSMAREGEPENPPRPALEAAGD